MAGEKATEVPAGELAVADIAAGRQFVDLHDLAQFLRLFPLPHVLQGVLGINAKYMLAIIAADQCMAALFEIEAGEGRVAENVRVGCLPHLLVFCELFLVEHMPAYPRNDEQASSTSDRNLYRPATIDKQSHSHPHRAEPGHCFENPPVAASFAMNAATICYAWACPLEAGAARPRTS